MMTSRGKIVTRRPGLAPVSVVIFRHILSDKLSVSTSSAHRGPDSTDRHWMVHGCMRAPHCTGLLCFVATLRYICTVFCNKIFLSTHVLLCGVTDKMFSKQFEILLIILNRGDLKSHFQVNAIYWSGEELDSCS